MYGYGMGGIGMIIVWTVPLLLIVALVYFINRIKKRHYLPKRYLTNDMQKGRSMSKSIKE